MTQKFKLVSKYKPQGDQPRAIKELVKKLKQGKKYQTLLGVTGSGKTFTIANVIEKIQLPTLVISHNKTLAAQLYSEFKEFFPNNAVEYFVSYYDYYQPEAYIPQRDIYIEKDASINEDIDRLRLSATSSLMTRNDVIIVASVSCIYGLGDPADYSEMFIAINKDQDLKRDELLRRLVNIQYERNDIVFERGKFRVRGDVVEIFLSYEDAGIRVEFFGDTVEKVSKIEPLTGEVINDEDLLTIFPAKHFVVGENRIERALRLIEEELEERLKYFERQNKALEAQRLKARTRYDMELLAEIGYCPGIENYSRHLSGRKEGERPYCLLDYYPQKFLMVVDESHVTIPQLRGMFEGDRSRKETLVEHGFRLPSALDNRPMRFDEWEKFNAPTIFVSATPSEYELEKCNRRVVEQIVRPTYLVDPAVRVEKAEGQVQHLLGEIEKRIKQNERALVTTLTKRLAEDLSEYLADMGLKVKYLHSEINTIERVEILRDLRTGRIDVVVGVNLLREGLDLPEVSLVAILDADKEGFLRSETSLIQTMGRAARNIHSEVILYADRITGGMKRALSETKRRREKQFAFNKKHNLTPKTIVKKIRGGIEEIVRAQKIARSVVHKGRRDFSIGEQISLLEKEMFEAAEKLEFERAAELRDKIIKLKAPKQINY